MSIVEPSQMLVPRVKVKVGGEVDRAMWVVEESV
jgi:hypothetical protein